MSVKLKQRFGEVLAIALIVTIVGFLVYMLIPSNPKTPKSTPVTVRSTAKVEVQSHAPVAAEQTPPSSHVLQEATVSNWGQNQQETLPKFTNGNSSKEVTVKKAAQSQNGDARGTVAVATTKAICTAMPKAVAKVGSLLQAIPVVGSLIPDVANCAS